MGEMYEVDPDGGLLISFATSVQNFVVENDEALTEPPANSEIFDYTETHRTFQ